VASQGKPNIVRMLLEKGAKVNVKDVVCQELNILFINECSDIW
jgi:hypothetical protein